MFSTVVFTVERVKRVSLTSTDEEFNLTVIPKNQSGKNLFPYMREVYNIMYIDYCEVKVRGNAVISHIDGFETSGTLITGYERKKVYTQTGGLYPRKKVIVHGNVGDKVDLFIRCNLVFTMSEIVFLSCGYNFQMETNCHEFALIVNKIPIVLYARHKFNFNQLKDVINSVMKEASVLCRFVVLLTCGMIQDLDISNVVLGKDQFVCIKGNDFKALVPYVNSKVFMTICKLNYYGSLADFTRHLMLLSKTTEFPNSVLYSSAYELQLLQKAIQILADRVNPSLCKCGKCDECLKPISLGDICKDMLKVFVLGTSSDLYVENQIRQIMARQGNLFHIITREMVVLTRQELTESLKASYAAVFVESVIALNNIAITKTLVGDLRKESSTFIATMLTETVNEGMLLGRLLCSYSNESSKIIFDSLISSKKTGNFKMMLNLPQQEYISQCVAASKLENSYDEIIVKYVYPFCYKFNFVRVKVTNTLDNIVFINFDLMTVSKLRETNQWYYVDLTRIRSALNTVTTCSMLQYHSSATGLRFISGDQNGNSISRQYSAFSPEFVKKMCDKEGSTYYDVGVTVKCDNLPYLVTEILSNLRCLRRVANNEHCRCS